MFARLIQSMEADGDQHHYGNVIDKEWWPADNFTSLALAAWQNWARLSQSKLRWLLKFLSTVQNPAPKDNELDCSFRSQHVPSFNALKAIIERLPKCSTTTAKCPQKITTHDGPYNKKVISAANADVEIILPSAIIRRELANPNVAEFL